MMRVRKRAQRSHDDVRTSAISVFLNWRREKNR
jgi:hypothetical protein